MARVKMVFTVVLVLAYIPILAVVLLLWSCGYLGAVIRGPNVVQSEASPDGTYVAYVPDEHSIDSPNQRLVVEWEDKTRFLAIAKLAEDIDSIKDIVWSPDSQIVVFVSRCYLTATRISDWQTIRIYLGTEWRRHRPSRRATFSGAQPIRRVSAVDFPAPDTVAYQIDDVDTWNMIQMNSPLEESSTRDDTPNQAVQASVAGDPPA